MLDRYLRNTTGAATVAYVLPSELEGNGLVVINLVDTDASSATRVIETGASITHWHVLWVRDERSGAVSITSDSTDETWPIAPGDTVSMPPGYRMSASGGQLALAIEELPGPGTTLAPKPPSHGHDRFAGYNRYTSIPTPHRLALFRWKITQPLDIRRHHSGDLMMVSLAGDPALLTDSTVIAPRRGHAVFAPAGSEPRILPNGLSYILVITPPQTG